MTMSGRPERIPFAAVTSHRLAARIEQSLIEGGYTPVGAIVPAGKPVVEILRQSLARIVFASPNGGPDFIAALLKAVREYDRALPVVMIAEPAEEEAAIEAMRAGARDYVLTDNLHRLPAIVERELREADWRREHAGFEARLQQTQRLESIGLLAGGVAHDFNNLLTGILGNSSMALDAVPRSSPARKMLSDVIEATQRAANLTRQLLAYAGKSRILSEPLDLSDLVNEIAVLLQSSIPSNVQLRSELQRRLPCVMGDAAQLQQLIMNLVINGAEAIGDISGTVLVTTGAQEVDEIYIEQNLQGDAILPGRYVTLEVHDSGSGMDLETKSRIFEPFFTTRLTRRGLGLPAARSIVQAHKGAIRVYSAPGQGSTFKVLLPATDEEAVPRHSGSKSRELMGREMVLIVDDEEIVRHTAKAALERYGYYPELATNGQDAIRMYAERWQEIALVLLDLTMPVLSGEETAKELLRIHPGCNILLSSGYNESEATRNLGSIKICGFLQKPYTAATLAEKVRQCLHLSPPASGGEHPPEARRGDA
jgi:signal transduction histidine kinase/ActR/RegA family two-component response regulator